MIEIPLKGTKVHCHAQRDARFDFETIEFPDLYIFLIDASKGLDYDFQSRWLIYNHSLIPSWSVSCFKARPVSRRHNIFLTENLPFRQQEFRRFLRSAIVPRNASVTLNTESTVALSHAWFQPREIIAFPTGEGIKKHIQNPREFLLGR